MAAPSPISIQTTTVIWGTKKINASGTTLASAIVISGQFTPVGVEATLENGDGARVGFKFLDDGWDATLECVEDSSITWPEKGDAISVVPPEGEDGDDKVWGTVKNVGAVKYQRKDFATRTIEVSYSGGINRVPVGP